MQAVKRLKATSAGVRHKTVLVYQDLAPNAPHKSLTQSKRRTNGRNSQGRITIRHRGGGHKRRYRLIDFKRNKDGVPAKVVQIEYDPNRTAHIALLSYTDGEWRYIVAPKDLKVGDVIQSGPDAPIKTGNALPMANIPVGSVIHCIEMVPLKGAQIARSAGAQAQLVAKDDGWAIVRMRSTEVRKIPLACRATLGVVSNGSHSLTSAGKAGATRHKGIRPTVRGVAMNPVDHPHGGGEGRTSGGRHPTNPTGRVKAKGQKTRSKRKASNAFIVTKRRKGRR